MGNAINISESIAAPSLATIFLTFIHNVNNDVRFLSRKEAIYVNMSTVYDCVNTVWIHIANRSCQILLFLTHWGRVTQIGAVK